VSLLLAEGRSVLDVAAQAGHAPTMTYDVYGHLISGYDEAGKRSAEDAIFEAREAGVRYVCDLLSDESIDWSARERELSAFAGLSKEALSGTRTLDPLLTMKVAKEEREGTDDPSSPSDPGDSGA
jgi:hypothetical protein